MNKGFINIFGVIAVAALAIGSLALHQVRQAIENDIDKNLGASITFTDLSNTIGTFRTNVNTALNDVNNQLVSSTSTDPGHLHTASAVSGTISVAKGGTGTSTLPTADGQLPIVSASTTSFTYTNAVPDCVAATSSKLLFTSSTKTWSCGTDSVNVATSSAGGLFFKSTSTSPYTTYAGSISFAKTTSTAVNSSEYINGRYLDLATTTLQGGFMGLRGGFRVVAFIDNTDSAMTFSVLLGSTTVATSTFAANKDTYIDAELLNRSSSSIQIGMTRAFNITDSTINATNRTNTAINTLIDQTLQFRITYTGSPGSDSTVEYFYLEPL